MGMAAYKGVAVMVRRELITLTELTLAVAKEVHGYTIWTRNPNGNGENWGPWGYQNRAISGTNTASNHSKGRAMDWNAPWNGYASSFQAIQSDFPPAMVRDIESLGWAWGGRYGDAMHWEFCWTPGDVARFEQRARQLLSGAGEGGVGTGSKPNTTDWWDEMSDAEKAQLLADVADIKNKLGWLYTNETLEGYGFSKTATIFEDVRAMPRSVLAALVGDRSVGYLLADIAQHLGIQVFGVNQSAGQTTYGVVSGDTFSGIAKKHGVTVDALKAANPQVKDINQLDVGQVLVIPKA
jgi:hypothetical protein